MSHIPFRHIDWAAVPKEENTGITGTSYWQTLQYDGLRVRIVTYSANYLADHWCRKGHIVYCLEGTFTSEEEETGFKTEITKGESYIVSDNLSSHRSSSANGATLLIIDGDFLK